MRRGVIYTVLSAVLAVCFTVYIALDTFVITRSYSTVDSSASSSSGDAAAAAAANGTTTEDSYQDDNISIQIDEYRQDDTTIYVADVTVSSPEYLKTALADGTYGKNVTETTSDIADSVGAILAINGDYYGVQESGYVIRNGTLYRSEAKDDQEDLVIYSDGTFGIINESEVTAQQLLDDGAEQVLCFGPGLVENGEISVTTDEEVDKAMTSNPRTAIGIIDDCHYVFVVADGRTSESTGLSLYQLAEFMQTLGVETAYNLDGGGSSTMVFNGEVINVPSSGSGLSSHSHSRSTSTSTSSTSSERSVSDIVYIGY